MNKLLIVHHSMTGGTRQMVDAAARGALAQGDIVVNCLPAKEAQASDVLQADGYLFATAENLAAMSGLMKDFFDRTYYAVLGSIEARAYACMICAGSDGQNAARQIERIATGWRLKPIALPLIVCTQAQTPQAILAPKTIAAHDLARCEELGATLASGLIAGLW